MERASNQSEIARLLNQIETEYISATRGISGLKARGINAAATTNIGAFLHQMQLQHTQTKILMLPLGSWGKRLGSLLATDMSEAFKGMKSLFVQEPGIDPQRYQTVVSSLTAEWNAHQTQFDFFLASGQRQL
ncbi:hypothetical protein [Ktedonobacter racemifer]|uniref:Uncharacterized protein n=1 Tax=Ktedonobacter racemifer DSM 44963 TaxID=485913 RepID=D6TQ52_KTERA|nr:hypothetical protein [Ktedonobacter racemifer]EFH85700.1 hypothetical protein Krac_6930 [Ktedonobacter racemifer DSM 44963]